MISDPSEIEQLIAASLLQVRADLGLPANSPTGPGTVLFGRESDLDSMGLVHLIAEVEARLRQRYGRDWILADERALSRQRSPFRTIGDLARFIIETTPET